MPISEAKKRNNAKYNQKCSQIQLRPLKDTADKIRAAAADAGQSLQGYILQACAERMARDAAQQDAPSQQTAPPTPPAPAE